MPLRHSTFLKTDQAPQDTLNRIFNRDRDTKPAKSKSKSKSKSA